MSVDPATLKPGDRIRCYGGSHGREATVLAVDGDDLWARWADGGGGTFVTYAFAAHLEFVPPPPLIDPEQVWCMYPPSETIYRHNYNAPGWQRFRITQIEMVE